MGFRATINESGEILNLAPPSHFHAAQETASREGDQYPQFTERPKTPGPEKQMLPGWQGEAVAIVSITAPLIVFAALNSLSSLYRRKPNN